MFIGATFWQNKKKEEKSSVNTQKSFHCKLLIVKAFVKNR